MKKGMGKKRLRTHGGKGILLLLIRCHFFPKDNWRIIKDDVGEKAI